MLLKIICTIFLFNVAVSKCEKDVVQLDEQVGYLTIKYGNTTEIHFAIEEPSKRLRHLQLDAIREEQIRQGALLGELMAKLNELKGLSPTQFPASCAEAAALDRRTGVYQILIPCYSVHPFLVSCNEDIQGGAWTTVLRRQDGSVDFFVYWEDYKTGFGNVVGEFFIGLDKLHVMAKAVDQELLIVMENDQGQHRFAKYDRFAIGSEDEGYKLHQLGKYSGDAGDNLRAHLGQKFSSRDRDNDLYEDNCAEKFTGGWWYAKCHVSNLMGMYNDTTFGKGINWLDFTTHTGSLKRVEMFIRPKRY